MSSARRSLSCCRRLRKFLPNLATRRVRKGVSSFASPIVTRCACSSSSTRCWISPALRREGCRPDTSRWTYQPLLPSLLRPFGPRSTRLGCDCGWTVHRCLRTSMSTVTCLRRSSSTCSPTHSSSRSPGRLALKCVSTRTQRPQRSSYATPAPAYPTKNFHTCSNAFIASRMPRGRSIEGSGIGLALVQELVRLHGGTIHVESEVGKGSAFTISLPFGTGHLPADKIVAHKDIALTSVRAHAYGIEAVSWLGGEKAVEIAPASGPQDLKLPVASRDGESPLILLADDNFDMRNYVERLLRLAGYRVKSVADGQAALSAASDLKPDLVLTDIMMPELNGFELLTKLRAEDELKSTPVILLSARAGEEAKIEGLRAGADDYLIKPFAARELLARVETNLQLARTRREAARLLREEALTLESLNRVGMAIAGELDLERTVQLVTDTATQLVGAAFGAFVSNVANQQGEAHTLHAVSGASREAFATFPIPPAFAATFRTESVVRSPDVSNDARFGRKVVDHSTLSEPLPVRSYLA